MRTFWTLEAGGLLSRWLVCDGVEVSRRDGLLYRIARDQRGVFTLAQAERCGVPASTVRGRTSRGVYELILPGVYGVAGSDDSWSRQVIAAVISTTEPAAASHRTAAYVWGMTDRRPHEIEVITRRHQRVKRRTFVVHESKDLRSSDIVQVDRIPVTSAVRTVVDLGASARLGSVARCLDTGLRTGLFNLVEVEAFIARVARKGRTGVGVIRPLIEERKLWKGITESTLEDRFRSIVNSSAVPMPEAQIVVSLPSGEFVGRYDFGYPECLAIFELDSEGFHMDPVSFQRDREKQNSAHALGWTVYRFTYRQLRDDPDSVIAVLASVLIGCGRYGR